MSLELAIQENTAALRDLIAALAAQSKPAAKAKAPKAEKPEPAPEPTPDPVAEAAPKPEQTAAAEPAAAPVDYSEAASWVIRLSEQQGSATARAVLHQFDGAGNLKDIPAERWGEVVAACRQALGA